METKKRKLIKLGMSKALTLPKKWLAKLEIVDDIELSLEEEFKEIRIKKLC